MMQICTHSLRFGEVGSGKCEPTGVYVKPIVLAIFEGGTTESKTQDHYSCVFEDGLVGVGWGVGGANSQIVAYFWKTKWESEPTI